jgi:dGTPase
MREHGGFNHNHQSYRVVTQLERRYPAFPGLNLTHETLHGLATHATHYDLTGSVGGDPALRGSLEAQIANFVDELAYNAHDLDDGLQAGLLIPSDLHQLEIWRELCDRLNWRGDSIDEISRHVFIRELVGMLVDDVLTTTNAHLQALKPQNTMDIQRHAHDVVLYTPRVQAMTKALKAYLYENLYYSYRVVRMKKRAERFIEQIFLTLVDDPRQLPPECHTEMNDKGLHRVVADYIASMTDRSALLEYRHLFDPLTRP